MHKIERLNSEQANEALPQLIALLQDAVHHGASVGFMPPLAPDIAEAYWLDVLKEVSQGNRILLVSNFSGELSGAVQLSLATKQNALHRAEVQKLFVHTRFRNLGIARMLMGEVEEAARKAGRSLLVLDTEQGSVAEKLYEKLGYIRAGVIPEYARSTDGTLHATIFFYRIL